MKRDEEKSKKKHEEEKRYEGMMKESKKNEINMIETNNKRNMTGTQRKE